MLVKLGGILSTRSAIGSSAYLILDRRTELLNRSANRRRGRRSRVRWTSQLSRLPSTCWTPACLTCALLSQANTFLFAMALVAITEEEQANGLKALSAELRYLFEEKSVDKEVMALLGHFGIVDGETFAAIASDETSLRKMLKDDLGLDAEGGIAVRVRASKVINSWRASRERIKRQTEMDAEARAEGRAREMPRPTQISLRRAYEELHGEVDDSQFPSSSYNNERITQIEEGEYRAEALSQVITFEEAREESGDLSEMNLTLTKSSTVKLTRSRTKVPMPRDPEELRARYRTMQLHWALMKMKHSDREIFKHLTDASWAKVLEYLLGPKVWKYRSSKGVGLSWDDLLTYEFEIRKRAMRRVTSHGVTIDDALTEAVGNDELRSMHFTLALVTSGPKAKESRPRSRTPKRDSKERNAWNEPKGKGKGKGKDKGGKGKNKGSPLTPEQIHAATLYNEAKKAGKIDYKHGKWNKCVRYNKLTCLLGDRCPNAHVCIICGEKHPLPQCKRG